MEVKRKSKGDYNTISLSCHEQVCNILVHDMINLLYYEYWTDKQKYLYVYKKYWWFFIIFAFCAEREHIEWCKAKN